MRPCRCAGEGWGVYLTPALATFQGGTGCGQDGRNRSFSLQTVSPWNAWTVPSFLCLPWTPCVQSSCCIGSGAPKEHFPHRMETSPRQKPPFPFPNRPHHSLAGPAHGLPKAADGFLWLLPGLLGPSLKEERAHIFRDPVPTAQGLWSVIYPLTDPRMVATQPLPGGTAFPAFSTVKGRPLCPARGLWHQQKWWVQGQLLNPYTTRPPSLPRMQV